MSDKFYTGRVKRVQWAEDTYHVLQMDVKDVGSVVVVGHVFGIQIAANSWFGFQAQWKKHPKYGKQLSITKAPVFKDNFDPDVAIAMLEGQGIRKTFCQWLKNHFGKDLVKGLSSVEALENVPGFSAFTAALVHRRWKSIVSTYRVLDLIDSIGLSKNRVRQIWSHFGDDVETVLTENPWLLVQIDGISFEQADEVSRQLGLDPNHPKRIEAALLYVLKVKRGFGHLFLTSSDVIQGMRSILGSVDNADIAKAIKACKEAQHIILDKKTRKGTMAIYEPWFHTLECDSAMLLSERASTALLEDADEVEYREQLALVGPKTKDSEASGDSLQKVARSAVEEWTSHGNFKLSEHQLEGAVNALTHPVSVITGLPGTGKCVVPNTWISSPEGFRQIKEYVPSSLPKDSSQDLKVLIDTSEGPKETAYVYNGGLSPTIRVTTSCGYSIEGTPEHPIRVVSEEEGLCWKKLGEITESDIAVLVKGHCYSWGRRELENPEDVALETIRTGEIPGAVMSSSRESVKKYLSSLFAGMGKVSSRQALIRLKCPTLEFAETLHFLLLALGIISVKRGTPGEIVINEDFNLFLDEVGLPNAERTKKRPGKYRHIIFAQGLLSRLMSEVNPKKGPVYQAFYRYARGRDSTLRRPTRAHVQKLLSYADESEVVEQLRFLCQEKFFFDPVKNIKKGLSKVLDFGVPENHEFLSNGFISHNTTLLKIVVKVLQDAAIPFLLVAPTGIAAKRISSVTGAKASTIHRAFKASGIEGEERESTYAGIVGDSNSLIDSDGSSENWGFSMTSPHPARVVIVDESSMVDQHLLFRLLSCTSRKCRFVFVGDVAQLPSVGPGNVLRNIIDSDLYPVVSLKEIFRQSDTSDIVVAAHKIHGGETPKFENSKDYVFLNIRSESQIVDQTLRLVQSLYSKKENFQVSSPRHAGPLGVTTLNTRIRDLLNPKSPGLQEVRIKSEAIREGDRIMVCKNNYNYEIFNGDLGKVSRIDLKSRKIRIKIYGPPVVEVEMPLSEAFSLLRLSYAATTHKLQGQEFDNMILPWSSSFQHQLQRNLFYTAITRAKKRVFILGHPEAVEKAVLNDKPNVRNTLFLERLQALKV